MVSGTTSSSLGGVLAKLCETVFAERYQHNDSENMRHFAFIGLNPTHLLLIRLADRLTRKAALQRSVRACSSRQHVYSPARQNRVYCCPKMCRIQGSLHTSII